MRKVSSLILGKKQVKAPHALLLNSKFLSTFPKKGRRNDKMEGGRKGGNKTNLIYKD